MASIVWVFYRYSLEPFRKPVKVKEEVPKALVVPEALVVAESDPSALIQDEEGEDLFDVLSVESEEDDEFMLDADNSLTAEERNLQKLILNNLLFDGKPRPARLVSNSDAGFKRMTTIGARKLLEEDI